EIEAAARDLIAALDKAGGTLRAIEMGLVQRQIQDAAYEAQRAIDTGRAQVVGVNVFQTGDDTAIPLLELDAQAEARQAARVAAMRTSRDAARWRAALDDVAAAAAGTGNLVPPI